MPKFHVFPVCFASRKRYPLAGIVILILAFASVVSVGIMYVNVQRLTSRATAVLAERNAERERTNRAKKEPTASEVEARQRQLNALRAIHSSLTVPWIDLFQEFEADPGPDVSLLGIDPDLQAGTVEVTAEGRDLMAMVRYHEHLSSSAKFEDVFVKQHEVQISDPQKPVRFVISLRWRLAALPAKVDQ